MNAQAAKKSPLRALPELLAPAGSADALLAAISAGADAVYFGAERFSARARAKNISASEMEGLLSECRAHGVRTHGAINIRLRSSELSDALELAETLLTLGTDSLIVADAGLAREILLRFPEAELHASTQITGTGVADAKALAALGFKRMVCPRELSLGEISHLCDESPIPIEAFIHGAHCVSVSGQCLMSYVLGGRSGNRGDCAGTCRLPFSVEGERSPKSALSLKDMCTAAHMRDIVNSGVASLKIEGRQKSAEYVYGTVSVYRRLLDEGRNATEDEISALAELFSRDGFSDGYLRKRYSSMLGSRSDKYHEEKNAEKSAPIPPPAKVPLNGTLCLLCGKNASLTLSSPFKSVTVAGEIVCAAVGNPPKDESLGRSVAKLGQTAFELSSLDIVRDEDIGIAASALNDLRRRAVAALSAPAPVVRADTVASKPTESAPMYRSDVVRTAELAFAAQMTESVCNYFDEIYLPLADFLALAERGWQNVRTEVGLSLPAVQYDLYKRDVDRALAAAREAGLPVLAHTVGELDSAVAAGCTVGASHRFSVWNESTVRVLSELGAAFVTLSPEIGYRAAMKFSRHAEIAALTGGRLPLMLCRRCPISDGGRRCAHHRPGGFCEISREGVCISSLCDRTGAKFPIVGDRYCMNTVYNSVATFCEIGDGELLRSGVSRTVYVFSSESAAECDKTVKRLASGAHPDGTVRKFR